MIAATAKVHGLSLVHRYRQAGGTATLRVVGGEGHTMWSGWFECQELVDLVVAHISR